MNKKMFAIGGVVLLLGLFIFVVLKGPIINSSRVLTGNLFSTPTPKILTKLTVIYFFDDPAKPAIAVATKNKLFEKYGLEVKVIDVLSAKAASQILLANQADIALTGQLTFLKAAAAGAKVKSVGIINSNQRFVLVSSKKQADIKTFCSAGKTSDTYQRGMRILKNIGIDVNNIISIDLASQDLCIKALAAGSADSMTLTEFSWEKFKEQNKDAVNYKTVIREEGDKYLIKPVAIIVMDNTLKAKKQAVEDFSKVVIEANYWLINHPEGEIANVITGVNKISKDDGLIFARLTKESLQGLRFTQDLGSIEANRKENENVSPQLKNYDVKSFLSTIISDSLTKQGFLQKYGF